MIEEQRAAVVAETLKPLQGTWRVVRVEGQAGPIMPYNNHQALRLFGATSLGVQLAPEISREETGHASRPKEPAAA